MKPLIFLVMIIISSPLYALLLKDQILTNKTVLLKDQIVSIDKIPKTPLSYTLLSYKGKPVCLANTSKYPSLIPSVWRDQLFEIPGELAVNKSNKSSIPFSSEMANTDESTSNKSSIKEMAEVDLPECGVEEYNRIYYIAQNAVLVDEQNPGVQVAGAGVIPLAVCLSGLSLGMVAGIADEGEPDGSTALWAIGGLGLGALVGKTSAGDFAMSKDILKQIIKSSSLIGACGLGGYLITVALLK